MNKDLIKQIILENQQYIGRIELIERSLSIEVEGNYVFVGSRRAGKTLVVQKIAFQTSVRGLSAS